MAPTTSASAEGAIGVSFGMKMKRMRATLRHYQGVFGPVRGVVVMARRVILGRTGPGSGQLIRARSMGYEHPIWLRFGATDDSTFAQVFSQLDYDLAYAHEPTTIIDAGANIGLASVYFAHRFPGARIVAIEPDPDNVRLLERNCAPYRQITVVEAALWTEPGHVSLMDPGSGEWGFRVGEEPQRDGTTTAAVTERVRASHVRAMTVPEAMELLGTDRLDLLKIDIEGGEREVFAECSDWIDRVRSVIIELHESTTPGATAAFEAAVGDFPIRIDKGENIYVSRDGDSWG